MLGMHIRSLLMSTGLAAAAWTAAAATVTVPQVNGGSIALKVSTLEERRFSATVPQKHDFSCGSAAVATLLSYHYATPVGEDEVFSDMYRRGDQPKIRREGFSLLDMKSYLDRHGFLAAGFRVELSELAAAQLPAIALITESRYNHFVVIKGMLADRVLIGDPARGARTLRRSEFASVWKSGIVLVVTADHGRSSFNSPADWDSAPLAPVSAALLRDGLGSVVIPKFGPGGF